MGGRGAVDPAASVPAGLAATARAREQGQSACPSTRRGASRPGSGARTSRRPPLPQGVSEGRKGACSRLRGQRRADGGRGPFGRPTGEGGLRAADGGRGPSGGRRARICDVRPAGLCGAPHARAAATAGRPVSPGGGREGDWRAAPRQRRTLAIMAAAGPSPSTIGGVASGAIHIEAQCRWGQGETPVDPSSLIEARFRWTFDGNTTGALE